MSEGDRKSEVRRKRPAVDAVMLAEAHRLYTARKLWRNRAVGLLSASLTVFFLFQLVYGNASAFTQVAMLLAGLGFIFGVNFVIANQDPDPDPAATERQRDEDRARRAEAKAIRDQQNAELRKRLDEKAAENRIKRDAENAVLAKKQAEQKQAAAELAIAMAVEQVKIERENRITELLILADTDTKRAIKLASKEGIDLHAEAQQRVQAGAAVIGAALGTGAQAGVEFVKHMLRSDSK